MLGQTFTPVGAFCFFTNGMNAVHWELGDSLAKGVFGVGVDEERRHWLMGKKNGCHEGLG